MEVWDALLLARIQFAFTVSFHFVFPALTIGLASYLAVLEILWLWRRQDIYLQLFRFWLKPFALMFAMGVVSGIVLTYQFGTNWSVYADRVGPVLGPLMAYEVLTAFFLEAGFLGLMLFGMDRVGRGLHCFATLAVAVGTVLSAFWIIAANSWMHTPAGFGINEAGQFVPESWWQIIFNPSLPFRLGHTVLAAYLTTALLVGATGAWHLLRDNTEPRARLMFSMAMGMVIVTAPIQILVGDFHGLNTLEHQPAKVMAMEGHFDSYPDGAPFYVVGWPDQSAAEIRYGLAIPGGSSLILQHDWNAPLEGLETVPREEWPPVAIVFWSFRIMVGLGVLMLLLGACGLYARLRKRLYDTRPLHRFALAMGPAGVVAVIAGWVTTEVGRQPYTVYGLLRTADSVSPLGAPALWVSLTMFVLVYCLVFGIGGMYLFRMLRKLPLSGAQDDDEGTPIRTAGTTPAAAIDPARMFGRKEPRHE